MRNLPNENDGNITDLEFFLRFADQDGNVDYQKQIITTLSSIDKKFTGFGKDLRGIAGATDDGGTGARRRGGATGAANAARYRRDGKGKEQSKSFLDGLTESFESSLGKADLEKELTKKFRALADKMGTTADQLPYEFGKQLSGAFQKTKIGEKFTGLMERNVNDYFMGIPKNAIQAVGSRTGKWGKAIADIATYSSRESVVPPASTEAATGGEGGNVVSDVVGNVANQAANAVGQMGGEVVGEAGGSAVGAALGSLVLPGVGTEIGGQLGGMIGGEVGGEVGGAVLEEGTQAALEGAAESMSGLGGLSDLVELAGPIAEYMNIVTTTMTPIQAVTPLIEGLLGMLSMIMRIFGRDEEMDEKRTENAKKRYKDDIETIVRTPFNILKDAANKVMQAWDDAIKVINQTQGYDKATLQDLMAVYAQRLRQEGLASVVSGADIVSNLAKVMESGLSGKIAEEFAYRATVLGTAIPTENFFSYASSYASIAANAMQQGKSQAEAIALANEQLDQFTSNLLYASRTISGGFTTGLQNASGLFDLAVQIANSSRGGNVSTISSVLTAVAGLVGAVAPDLAPGLTTLIGNLATGGNNSSIVALRSLAGINASNTEFLQALARDPQGVFARLFSGLAQYQNMSNTNYMEVAEGLAEVFGVDMGALARVDFAALADSIQNMSVNSASLQENMELLQSGQSTLNADQQRYQEINKFMIEEGLALVLDNEAARAIQEHMWEEQIANQIMENQFAIDLQGEGLDLLKSLRSTVKNILTLFFPWFEIAKGAVNLITTSVELADQETAIMQILNAGKVGMGNANELRQLTTRGVQNLGLIGDLQTLFGVTNPFHIGAQLSHQIDTLLSGNWNMEALNVATTLGSQLLGLGGSLFGKNISSQYKWGAISKSARNALSGRFNSVAPISAVSAEETAAQNLEKHIQDFLASMDAAVQSEMKFTDWLDTSTKFGLNRSELESSLSKVGQSMTNLENAFGDKQTEKEKERSLERQNNEELFWKKSTLNEDSYLSIMTDKLTDIQRDIRNWSINWDNVNNRFSAYYGETPGTLFGTEAMAVSSMDNANSLLAAYKEKLLMNQIESPVALAEALVDGLENLDIREPTAQTNVLLAQLIKVVISIFQAMNTPGQLDIPSSLSAMALGLMTPTE